MKNYVKIYAAESRVIDIYLNREIGAPCEHLEELKAIKEAGASDLINLYVNGPGGRIDTMLQFVAALAGTDAHVVGHLEGEACSAHTFLLLCSDEWVISPFALFMAHNSSGGSYGKGKENVQWAQASLERTNKIMREMYRGFFSEEEINSIIDNNTDYWLQSDEIESRLQSLVAHREKLMEELDLQNKEEVRKQLQEYVGDSEE